MMEPNYRWVCPGCLSDSPIVKMEPGTLASCEKCGYAVKRELDDGTWATVAIPPEKSAALRVLLEVVGAYTAEFRAATGWQYDLSHEPDGRTKIVIMLPTHEPPVCHEGPSPLTDTCGTPAYGHFTPATQEQLASVTGVMLPLPYAWCAKCGHRSREHTRQSCSELIPCAVKACECSHFIPHPSGSRICPTTAWWEPEPAKESVEELAARLSADIVAKDAGKPSEPASPAPPAARTGPYCGQCGDYHEYSVPCEGKET